MEIQEPADSPALPHPDQLEIAHQRLLTYLKALHVPVRRRAELAEQSLARAEAGLATGGDFVSSAMRHLQALLGQSQPEPFQRELGSVEPMPPLNRGSMIPVSMERTGPITFFFSALLAGLKRLAAPPLRLYALLLALGAALALYWWLRMGGP